MRKESLFNMRKGGSKNISNIFRGIDEPITPTEKKNETN